MTEGEEGPSIWQLEREWLDNGGKAILEDGQTDKSFFFWCLGHRFSAVENLDELDFVIILQADLSMAWRLSNGMGSFQKGLSVIGEAIDQRDEDDLLTVLAVSTKGIRWARPGYQESRGAFVRRIEKLGRPAGELDIWSYLNDGCIGLSLGPHNILLILGSVPNEDGAVPIIRKNLLDKGNKFTIVMVSREEAAVTWLRNAHWATSRVIV